MQYSSALMGYVLKGEQGKLENLSRFVYRNLC